MLLQDVRCRKCGTLVPDNLLNSPQFAHCPSCGASLAVWIFPALFRQEHLPNASILDDESSCYYHETNRAETFCDSCGRFLCHVCVLKINGRHICPACLETALSRKRIPQFESQFFAYDELALSLALVSFVFPCFILAAPASLYYIFRYWNVPKSVLPKSRWREYVAIFLNLGAILLFSMLILTILTSILWGEP